MTFHQLDSFTEIKREKTSAGPCLQQSKKQMKSFKFNPIKLPLFHPNNYSLIAAGILNIAVPSNNGSNFIIYCIKKQRYFLVRF